ncbi:MAG: hypothetical protein FWD05_07300 [Oscillospiraceae bacterium]|nr:hypothetical protein [Oscillospiraceae bacterium]
MVIKMPKQITKFTQKIEYLATKTNFIYNIASRYYRDVVQKEIDLANITEDDHVLFIGGGFCPFSAILLNQASGARVTVIDNNSDCIIKAGEVVSRLGIADYVNLKLQDGGCSELSLCDYTVIHFALQVTPIEHVFKEIEKKVSPGTKLLIRRPKECLSRMYCKLAEILLTCCQHISHSKTSNIGNTYLYIKNENTVIIEKYKITENLQENKKCVAA